MTPPDIAPDLLAGPVDWREAAKRLAASVTHQRSRWRFPLQVVPRHVFVPAYFRPCEGGYWRAVGHRDDSGDPAEAAAHCEAAYRDRTLVTRVGAVHADQVGDGQVFPGEPTSSATLPSLLLQMYRHALLDDGMSVLDAGTGSGYGAALLSQRLGQSAVTSVDVDRYLVDVARERLAMVGYRPAVDVADITGELPGSYDRIIATVSVHHVPASWVQALPVGGRAVFALTDTAMIVAVDKMDDGTLRGRVAWDQGGFMPARHDTGTHSDSPVRHRALVTEGDSEVSPYPIVDVGNAFALWSTYNLARPGVRHEFIKKGENRTALMWSDIDGSWARAVTSDGDLHPLVTQGGPRRLWDALDDLRTRWLEDGELRGYGARVRVDPDGTTTLKRGTWKAVRKPQ